MASENISSGIKIPRSSEKLLVAAIDFGTTYSGVAYSFKHEFKSDPTNVKAKTWSGGKLLSSKGPTCILIKPDGKTFDSFGYDAETKYGDLATEEEHEDWYYFRHFKMALFSDIGLKRNSMLEDVTKKKLSAKLVFKLSICYLKDTLLEMVRKRLTDEVTNDEIQWVLTVPAIWNDAAKHFMREAAEEAGISGDNLTIALEPECASLYCRHISVEKVVEATGKSLGTFKAGTKYLVLDAGGGTVDITVHEVNKDGTVKELYKASGGAWGGIKVDQAFENFLIELFGGALFRKFKQEHMDDYTDIFRDFETKKRNIDGTSGKNVVVRLPSSLIKLFEKKQSHRLCRFRHPLQFL